MRMFFHLTLILIGIGLMLILMHGQDYEDLSRIITTDINIFFQILVLKSSLMKNTMGPLIFIHLVITNYNTNVNETVINNDFLFGQILY